MLNDIYSLYSIEGIEQCMKEIDRIDDIIAKRESGPFKLPADFNPELGDIEAKRIMEICEALEMELASRGFDLILQDNLPLKAYYLYLKHAAFTTEGLRVPGGYRRVDMGCNSWCDDCFQKPWCRTRHEFEEITDENSG